MPSRPKDAKGREKKNELAWMVTFEFVEAQAMQDWGLTPRAWRLEPKDDRIKMMAMTRVKANMEQADNEVMHKRIEKTKDTQGDRRTRRLR